MAQPISYFFDIFDKTGPDFLEIISTLSIPGIQQGAVGQAAQRISKNSFLQHMDGYCLDIVLIFNFDHTDILHEK